MSTKKALLIGINEFQSISALRGCVSDVQKYKRLLRNHFGFSAENIRTLVDEEAIKPNVLEGLDWLIEDAHAGDSLVFMVASHGSHVLDEDGDEDDGVDEIICLWDMDFSNSESYLLDDEIRKFTERLPPGASLTIIFDSCNSGTGTRLLLHPESGTRAAIKGIRSRYLTPPPEVLLALNKAGTRSAFADLSADETMNHIFFAGCKADQTSADAEIEGEPHGAFSFYFCKAVTESPEADLQEIIKSVRNKLRKANFAQEPQLEPKSAKGGLFSLPAQALGKPETRKKPKAAPAEGPGSAGSVVEGPIAQEILSVLRDIHARLGGMENTSRGSDKRAIVYVHGICKHDETFADGWWEALRPHLSPTLRNQLQNERHPVVWSDLVTPTRAILPAGVPVREMQHQHQKEEALSAALRDSIEDRAMLAALESLPEEREFGPHVPQSVPLERGLVDASGLNCIDDFTKYLLRDAIRRAVQKRFFEKILPLLEAGYEVDVMSHSWGTVVAYEALRQLDERNLPGRVLTLFTFGSALSFKMIKRQLQTGDLVRPRLAKRWVNLDAKRDFVGGALKSMGYGVDEEYLGLEAVGCQIFGSNPWCPHSSYFHTENLAVNRDILARLM